MSRDDRERGAAAVEFALVVPLLLMLVLGIVEFGRAYNIQTTVSNAARDGVRVMALGNDPAAARSAAESSLTHLGLTGITVDVTPSTCAATGLATAGTATVTVSYPFELLTGFLPIKDFPLTGKGTMRCNG